MDFKDWRNSPTRPATGDEATNKYRGKRFSDYIEEQIRAAEERGEFRNLRGMGQPLNLDINPYAGERSLGYSLLKSNGYAPPEVELAREIRQDLERLESRRAALSRRGRDLRRRPLPPFTSEKRAYNTAVSKALAEYEAALGELNRKILTLNLSAPASMHRPSLHVEQMVSQFREECPLFSC
jgi:DnaJ homolog subfamily C member 28